MAFSRPIPHAFTRASVEQYAPPVPGVYGLSNARQWVFISAAGNIREALKECLSAEALTAHNPTGFVYEICDSEHLEARCARLIVEYSPVCNLPAAGERRGGRSRWTPGR
jgi:hypothetical protein